MQEKFSVLMSIYRKEKPEYARACFDSLLRQTVQAAQWVIVEDGPLTEELYAVLDEYEKAWPHIIKRVPFAENRGLGLALRDGVLNCDYPLIARMDTDDICREDRFEKQLAMFAVDEKLDICGCQILEFDGSPDNIVACRKVPLTDGEIKRYQRRRDGLNHVTVMFKKEAVLRAGNYQSCLLMEDTLLWANMFQTGATCVNIDESLVYVRTGSDMFARRGGFAYFKKYKTGRKQVYETGFISRWDYVYTLAVQLVVALIPNGLRTWVYRTLLRSK